MSIERVRKYFEENFPGVGCRILEFTESSATVSLAAQALNCEPGRIAKTLSFYGKDGVILVVAAGTAKIDNKKFKGTFGLKARMLSPEDAENLVGHAVGGVCPFALPEAFAGCEPLLATQGAPQAGVLRPWEAQLYLREL